MLVAFAPVVHVHGGESPRQLRVDRWTKAGEPLEIDQPTVQRIAEKVGSGHFFVTNVGIGRSPASKAAMTRLFAFYPVTLSGPDRIPKAQALLLPDGNGCSLEGGTPPSLLAAFFSNPLFASMDDDQVSEIVAAILSAGLFGETGRWLNTRDAGIFQPVMVHSATSLTWKESYLREDGGVEELAVAVSSQEASQATVSRRELHPAGFFHAEVGNELSFEEWNISGGANWRPSQRYKMMTTLAALGNPAKQFQLAAALLQESEDGAKTEGMKWLRVSASQGYQDAIDLLHQSGEELRRPDRDRDKVRLSRCCPVPGR